MALQFKQTLRAGFAPRLPVLIVVIALNAAFLIANAAGAHAAALRIIAVALAGSALAALIIVQIIADANAISQLFKAPQCYTVLLTPTKGWKILLGRVLGIAVMDAAGLIIGIAGVAQQALLLANIADSPHGFGPGEALWTGVTGFIGYLLLLMFIVFACAMAKGYLSRFRASGILAVVTTVALMYALGLMDFILLLFAPASSFGPWFVVTLGMSANPGMIAYVLLLLVKAAVLFMITANSIERRLNV